MGSQATLGEEDSMWGKIVEFLKRENAPVVLIVLGLLLFVIGAAAGFPKLGLQINEGGWRYALAGIGIVAAGLGVFMLLRPTDQELGKDNRELQKDYGIKITKITYLRPDGSEAKEFISPAEVRAIPVPELFNVEGRYKHKLPNNIAANAFERNVKVGKLWSKGAVDFRPDGTWVVPSVHVSGSPGRERAVVVAIMGRGAQPVVKYHEELGTLIWEAQQNNNPTFDHPGIPEPIPDLKECDSIRVVNAPAAKP